MRKIASALAAIALLACQGPIDPANNGFPAPPLSVGVNVQDGETGIAPRSTDLAVIVGGGAAQIAHLDGDLLTAAITLVDDDGHALPAPVTLTRFLDTECCGGDHLTAHVDWRPAVAEGATWLTLVVTPPEGWRSSDGLDAPRPIRRRFHPASLPTILGTSATTDPRGAIFRLILSEPMPIPTDPAALSATSDAGPCLVLDQGAREASTVDFACEPESTRVTVSVGPTWRSASGVPMGALEGTTRTEAPLALTWDR